MSAQNEMLWLRDHNIEGEILLPFTGFITQVIRALRTLHAELTPGVGVRELYIKRALRIEEDGRVDITTRLRPAGTGTEAVSSSTWKFEIFTWSEAEGWVSHCHGLIEAESQGKYVSVPVTRTAIQALNDVKSGGAIHIEAEAEYNIMRDSGLLYESAFARMRSLWEFPDDPSILVGEIEIGDFRDYRAEQPSPVKVDAATLDACLHLASRIQGPRIPRPMCIPSHVHRLRISNNIPLSTGDRATFVAKLHYRDEKSGDMGISCVTFAHVGKERIPVAATEDVTFKCIARPQADDSRGAAEHWTTEHVALADVMEPNSTNVVTEQDSKVVSPSDQTIVICGQFDVDAELEFAETVAEALEQHTRCICTVQHIDELDLSDSPFCIFIDSHSQSILTDFDPQAFEMLESFSLDAAGLLWIAPENPPPPPLPEARFIGGFLRTLLNGTDYVWTDIGSVKADREAHAGCQNYERLRRALLISILQRRPQFLRSCGLSEACFTHHASARPKRFPRRSPRLHCS